MVANSLTHARAALENVEAIDRWGEVSGALGLLVEVAGLPRQAVVGDAVQIALARSTVLGEIVGFRGASALVMPFGGCDGIGPGARVSPSASATAEERIQRLRYHCALPSAIATPWTMPSPVNQ